MALAESHPSHFHTSAEYYADMRDFHNMLPQLLKPDGVYSYFNGLAPDNIFFHMVSPQKGYPTERESNMGAPGR